MNEEHTGEDAASAAGRILSGNDIDRISERLSNLAADMQAWLKDVEIIEAILVDYRNDAETAAASALTQVEPKP